MQSGTIPAPGLLSLPDSPKGGTQLTITPGTFWQENGEILIAEIDCPKQEKQKNL